MNFRNKIYYTTIVIMFSITGSFSQLPDVTEINKIGFLVGEWKGEGWMRTPQGNLEEFTVSEKVSYKLNQKALLFEGLGKSIDESTGNEKVVHNALAILSFAVKEQAYKFYPVLENGSTVDTYFKLSDAKTIIWGFDLHNGGAVKYTLTINDQNQWHEKGAYSRDGINWNTFLEMTLDKIN